MHSWISHHTCTYLRKESNSECCQWSWNIRSTGLRGNDWLAAMPGSGCPFRRNNISKKPLSLSSFRIKFFSCATVSWTIHTSLREKKPLILFFWMHKMSYNYMYHNANLINHELKTAARKVEKYSTFSSLQNFQNKVRILNCMEYLFLHK